MCYTYTSAELPPSSLPRRDPLSPRPSKSDNAPGAPSIRCRLCAEKPIEICVNIYIYIYMCMSICICIYIYMDMYVHLSRRAGEEEKRRRGDERIG